MKENQQLKRRIYVHSPPHIRDGTQQAGIKTAFPTLHLIGARVRHLEEKSFFEVPVSNRRPDCLNTYASASPPTTHQQRCRPCRAPYSPSGTSRRGTRISRVRKPRPCRRDSPHRRRSCRTPGVGGFCQRGRGGGGYKGSLLTTSSTFLLSLPRSPHNRAREVCISSVFPAAALSCTPPPALSCCAVHMHGQIQFSRGLPTYPTSCNSLSMLSE